MTIYVYDLLFTIRVLLHETIIKHETIYEVRGDYIYTIRYAIHDTRYNIWNNLPEDEKALQPPVG